MGKICTTLAMLLAVNGQVVQATCWSQDELAAAKIRTLDEMLMVSSLRCRLVGVDFQTDYADFSTHHRGKVLAASLMLKAHFGSAVTYDRFVTSVANHYGGGVPGVGCGELATLTRIAADPARETADLVALADRMGISPASGEEFCDTIARR